jgi:uncharacterized protein (DUF3820 family)
MKGTHEMSENEKTVHSIPSGYVRILEEKFPGEVPALKMTYGSYRGVRITDLPDKELQYAWLQEWVWPSIRKASALELARRGFKFSGWDDK